MRDGMTKLSCAKSFRLFPVLWQTFLWSWGGFLLSDRLDEEYAQLAKETGVPIEEVPIALSSFDEIFPIKNGWFRETHGRRLIILMPAAMRGLGAVRRKVTEGVPSFTDLKCAEVTKEMIARDNNSLATLLDCDEEGLVK